MPARGKKKAKSGPCSDKTKDDNDAGAASSSSDVETDAKKDKAPTAAAASSSPSSSTAAVDEAAKHHRIELLSHAYRKTSVAKAFGNAVAELVQENPRLQDSIGEMVLLLDEAMVENLEAVRYGGGRTTMECELDTYNNVEEQWRLLLKDAKLQMESSTTEADTKDKVEKVWLTAVDADMVVKERGWKRRRLT